MTVSFPSRNTLERIIQNGGSIGCKGNQRSGDALLRRGLVTYKKGRIVITAKGRKWIEKKLTISILP